MRFPGAVGLCLALLAVLPAAAQSNAAFGELHGGITDPTGARVGGAKVDVSSRGTGFTRLALTNEDGEYRLLLLPPGDYDIQVEKEGFRTHVSRDVRVTVGQIANLDIHLELGPVSERIEVTARPLLLEAERSHQASTMEKEIVQSLPINRRDYLTFALLAPGVADSSALADNTDYRIKQAPNSGLSFYGSNGRGNWITVDGGEANDSRGGVRPTISQEAVQEFQINRSNYSAELGGASGGVIAIVSKSGTNRIHSSLFGFFRDQSLDAGDPFAADLRGGALTRIKPPSQRQQFGGTAGLPLKRDQTFLFAAMEGLRRRESSAVSVLTDLSIFQPTPAQRAILDSLPPADAAPLRAALTSPAETVDLFKRNSGVFPFFTDDWKFSLRLDHRPGPADQLFFRYNYTNSSETNSTVRALVGATRGTRIETLDSTSILGWTHAFSERDVNEARFQWNYRNFLVNSLETFGPQINLAGFGFFNRDLTLPSNTIERRYEAKDSFTRQRGSHILKFGGSLLFRGNSTNTDLYAAGSFNFGQLPGSMVSPALASTTINSVQSFNLGLAQAFRIGFGDPIVSSTDPTVNLFLQDSWKVSPFLTLDFGLRYELDDRRDPMPTDTNNFAPRVGFAWDPFQDKKTTVRGGYGIFYSPTYYHIDYVAQALADINGHRQFAQVATNILTPGLAAPSNIFRTLRGQGVITLPTPSRPIRPADLTQFGLAFNHTGPIPASSVMFYHAPDYVNSYSQQASLEIERELARDLVLSASYTFVRTLKITRARDTNLLPAPVDPRLGIRVWSAPYFVNPLLAQNNIYESSARALYSGMIVELRKRFSRSFSLNAHYTLSKATDDVVDFNSGFQANEQTNLAAEHALSSFDQRHKFVAFALWAAPRGLQLAPIFRANSARPFNLYVGSDLNGDRHPDTDRPAFAGRNTGIGPNFWTFDLRLSRRMNLGERSHLELIGEAFNLFNRLNFASINNGGLGNMPGPFHIHGRHDRTPSQPLGFTSAFDPRRIQVGFRLSF